MNRHNKLKRYSLIFEKVRGRFHPTFTDIQDYLRGYDIEVSKRTIQRDLRDIREEFGIEIVCDASSDRYSVNEEASPNLESFYRLMEMAITADFIAEGLKEGTKILEHVEFEGKGMIRGAEHLRPILHAIRKRRYLEFQHANFETGRSHTFKVAPFYLKEYRNRFYLFGRQEGVEDSWQWGLDRISELTVTGKACPAPTSADRKAFAEIIGVSGRDEPTEEVILGFDPGQAKYIKSLPWHSTQEIIQEDKREVVIKLKVKCNWELKEKILSQGPYVRVIKPQSFAKAIKAELAEALKLY